MSPADEPFPQHSSSLDDSLGNLPIEDTSGFHKLSPTNRMMRHRSAKIERLLFPLILTFWGMLIPYFSVAYAQEDRPEGSGYSSLSMAKLVTKFKKGEFVSNGDIDGNVLIEIMRTNKNLEIRIKNSIIRNGLNFRDLNEINSVYLVDHNITIKSTIIEAKKYTVFSGKNKTIKITQAYSVYAEGTLFQNVSFEEVVFKEKVRFNNATFNKRAVFRGSIFKGLDFNGADFNEKSVFDEVIVERDSDFGEATFFKDASFNAATFGGNLDFNSAEFKNQVSFEKTDFGGELEFELAKIKGEAIFSKATFHNQASFLNSVFHEKVEFDNTIFHQEAYFRSAQFGGERVNGCTKSPVSIKNRGRNRSKFIFKTIQFKKEVFFDKTFFKEGFSLQDIIFEGKVHLREGVFCEKVFFYSTFFKDTVAIDGTEFLGDTKFSDTFFSEESSFEEVHFQGKTLFEQTQFLGTANFSSAVFKQAEFDNVIFHGSAYFRDTLFDGLDIKSTQFKGHIDFRSTTIDNLDFGNGKPVMVIPGNLDLRDASLTQTKFQDLIFLADVDFLGTNFQEDITFDSVNFKGTANFTGANFDDAALSFSNTNYSNLLITMKQIPYPESWKGDEKDEPLPTDSEDHSHLNGPLFKDSEDRSHLNEPLSKVFKKLEDQFRLHNQIEDANEAYFQSMVAQRKAAWYGWTQSTMFEGLWSSLSQSETLEGLWTSLSQSTMLEDLWSSLWMFPLEKCCGYGAKFWRIVGWSILGYLIFALSYYRMGRFVALTKEEIAEDSIFKLNIFVLPKQYLKDNKEEKNKEVKNQKPIARLKSAFMLSLLLMCKVGHRKTQVYKGPWIKGLVWFEWAFGYLWFVAMAITLKNTSPIINTILSIF